MYLYAFRGILRAHEFQGYALKAINRSDDSEQQDKLQALYQQVIAGTARLSDLMAQAIETRRNKKLTSSIKKIDVLRSATDQVNSLLCSQAADMRHLHALEEKKEVISQAPLLQCTLNLSESAKEAAQLIRQAIHKLESTEHDEKKIRDIQNCRTTAMASLKVKELLYLDLQSVNKDLMKTIIYLQESLNRASIKKTESVFEKYQRELQALSEMSQNLFGCSLSEWVMQARQGILPDITSYTLQAAYVFAGELLAERDKAIKEGLIQEENRRLKQSESALLINQQAEERRRSELRQQLIKVPREFIQQSAPAKSRPEIKRKPLSFFDSKYQERMREGGFRLVYSPVNRIKQDMVKLAESPVDLHPRVSRWNLSSYPDFNGFFREATAFNDLALNGKEYRYANMKKEQLLDQSRRHYVPGIADLMGQKWFKKNYAYLQADNTASLLAEDTCQGENPYKRTGWISIGYNSNSIGNESSQSIYHLFFHDENEFWSAEGMRNQVSSPWLIDSSSSKNRVLTNSKEQVQITSIEEIGNKKRRPVLEIKSKETFTATDRVTRIYPLTSL